MTTIPMTTIPMTRFFIPRPLVARVVTRVVTLAALCVLSFGVPARADIIKQSTAYNRDILVTDTSGNNVTGLSSGAFMVKVSKAGGAQTTVTPTITEKALGHYNVAYTTSMTDTLGNLALVITAAGAVQTDVNDQIVAFDPNDAAALGLSTVGTILTRIGTPAGSSLSADLAGEAAATLTTFKADTQWKIMYDHAGGPFDFNPITGVITMTDDSLNPLRTLTLTRDSQNNITRRR